jgi:hypothetical protein
MTPTELCQWPVVGIGPGGPFAPVPITLVLASIRTSIAYGEIAFERAIKSCAFAQFAVLVGLSRARPGRPRSPSADNHREACRSRRRWFGGRGIRASQAAVADPQSDPETGTESPPHGSRRRWSVCAPRAPMPAGPFRDGLEARHALPPSSSAEDSEISPPALAHGTEEAGPAGTRRSRARHC